MEVSRTPRVPCCWWSSKSAAGTRGGLEDAGERESMLVLLVLRVLFVILTISPLCLSNPPLPLSPILQ